MQRENFLFRYSKQKQKYELSFVQKYHRVKQENWTKIIKTYSKHTSLTGEGKFDSLKHKYEYKSYYQGCFIALGEEMTNFNPLYASLYTLPHPLMAEGDYVP